MSGRLLQRLFFLFTFPFRFLFFFFFPFFSFLLEKQKSERTSERAQLGVLGFEISISAADCRDSWMEFEGF